MTFSIPKFAPSCKKSAYSIDSFLRYVQSVLESCDQTGHTQLLFYQLLIYLNLHQHAKNQAISLICSGDMVG